MTVLIAQISDIHAARGAASLAALDRALDYLSAQKPDAIIVSGDVSNKPHAEGYPLARQALAAAWCPVFMVPGNVDDRDAMRATFPDAAYWPPEGPLHVNEVVAGAVRVVGLDVTVPGETYGEVTTDCLDFLATALDSEPSVPALVFMHQHPFPLHSSRLDKNMCRNVEPLSDVLRASRAKVLGVVCGHAHRAASGMLGPVPARMSPPLVTSNPALVEGHAAPPVTDPPGLLLHAIDGDSLVTHTISLG